MRGNGPCRSGQRRGSAATSGHRLEREVDRVLGTEHDVGIAVDHQKWHRNVPVHVSQRQGAFALCDSGYAAPFRRDRFPVGRLTNVVAKRQQQRRGRRAEIVASRRRSAARMRLVVRM